MSGIVDDYTHSRKNFDRERPVYDVHNFSIPASHFLT